MHVDDLPVKDGECPLNNADRINYVIHFYLPFSIHYQEFLTPTFPSKSKMIYLQKIGQTLYFRMLFPIEQERIVQKRHRNWQYLEFKHLPLLTLFQEIFPIPFFGEPQGPKGGMPRIPHLGLHLGSWRAWATRPGTSQGQGRQSAPPWDGMR